MTQGSESANARLARKYFDLCDGRIQGDVGDLFTSDVEIFLPKYGVERGPGIFANLLSSLPDLYQRIEHHVDEFKVLEFGDTIVVEGTTEGTTATGLTWDGRVTLGGRFCSVFEIHEGLISRMYIYLDPDYCSQDTTRYPYFVEDKAHR